MKLIIALLLLSLAHDVLAMPKIKVTHQRNIKGFAEVQVVNSTSAHLICYVAIDGHKKFFRLQALQASKWYVATDIRYNHTHFSLWCDYLSLHPKYQ